VKTAALAPRVSTIDTPWKADDRAWFERHPEAQQRLRPVARGEVEMLSLEVGTSVRPNIDRARAILAAHQADGARLVVLVVQLEQGIRTRLLGVAIPRRGKVRYRLLLPWGEETLAAEQLDATAATVRAGAQGLAAEVEQEAKRWRDEGDACALCGEAFGAVDVTLAVSFDHETPRCVCILCGEHLGQIGRTRPTAIVGVSLYFTKATSDELAKPNPSPALLATVEAMAARAAALRAALGGLS
jgi:hypothetical protein